MTLYQVVLNKIDDRSPIFLTREEAVALVRNYRNYAVRRGCDIVTDQEDKFSAIWGGWSEHHCAMWIREIKVGEVPATWKDFN